MPKDMYSEPGTHIPYTVFLDYLAGEMSPEEQALFELYLREHPDEQEVLEGAKVLLETGMTPEEVERDLETLRSSSSFLPELQPVVAEARVIDLPFRTRVLRLAAVCALVVMVGLWARQMWKFMAGNMYGAHAAMTVVHVEDAPLEAAIRIDSMALSPPLAEERPEAPTIPKAAFVISDTGEAIPLVVHFVDQTSGDSTLVSWEWGFGDGGTSAALHTFREPAQYATKQYVSNGCSFDSASTSIRVYPPPIAAFQANSAQGCEPLAVQFAPAEGWQWGTDSAREKPRLLFTSDQVFQLALISSNPSDSSESLNQSRASFPVLFSSETSLPDSHQTFSIATPAEGIWSGPGNHAEGTFDPGLLEESAYFVSYYMVGQQGCVAKDSLVIEAKRKQFVADVDTLYPIPSGIFAAGPDDGFSQEALDRSLYLDSLWLDSLEQLKAVSTGQEKKSPIAVSSPSLGIPLALHPFSVDTHQTSAQLGNQLIQKLQQVDQDSFASSQPLFTFLEPTPASTLWVHQQIPPDLFRPFTPIEGLLPKSQHILLQKLLARNRFHLKGSIQHLELHNQQKSLSFLSPEQIQATLTVVYQLLDRTDDSILCEDEIKIDKKGMKVWHLSTHGLSDSAMVDTQLRAQILDELLEDAASEMIVQLSACMSDQGPIKEARTLPALHIPNAMYLSASSDQLPFSRFQPKGQGIQSYHLAVYSTAGELVWESRELEDGKPRENWDGKVGKKPADGEVFVWKLHEITFDDGSLYEGPREGSLTVIR